MKKCSQTYARLHGFTFYSFSGHPFKMGLLKYQNSENNNNSSMFAENKQKPTSQLLLSSLQSIWNELVCRSAENHAHVR